MRKQLVLIIPILAVMLSMLAIGLNSANAQNMSTPETNMTGGSNATIGGNMTSAGNMTNESTSMMTNSS